MCAVSLPLITVCYGLGSGSSACHVWDRVLLLVSSWAIIYKIGLQVPGRFFDKKTGIDVFTPGEVMLHRAQPAKTFFGALRHSYGPSDTTRSSLPVLIYLNT